MEMHKTLSVLVLLLGSCSIAFGQTSTSPKIQIEVQDAVILDNISGNIISIPTNQRRITNYNPSVNIGDSTLSFIFDSLRTDGRATIITVYETEAINPVGLWQIGSGDNRAQWLNSQQVSYENFTITYRDFTEHGVVIHTMLYQYPGIDSTYDGHDTIYFGTDGNIVGDKNFCAFYYYPCNLIYSYWTQLESALAIRYGALLHGPYVNSRSDTLWNPIGADSLYSYGICGVGRDDSLSLMQLKSIIRNGLLSIELINTPNDLTHVMMGHNGGENNFSEDVVLIDTVQYSVFERQWKLRSHGQETSELIRIGANLPISANAIRLMLISGDNIEIIGPESADSIVFDNISIINGQDYFVSLLIDPTAIPHKGKGNGHILYSTTTIDYDSTPSIPDFCFTAQPNPTTGHYTADISQTEANIISMYVLDATGRVIEHHSTSEKLGKYKHTGIFDADGVYYITASSNGRRKTVKIIVVK